MTRVWPAGTLAGLHPTSALGSWDGGKRGQGRDPLWTFLAICEVDPKQESLGYSLQ